MPAPEAATIAIAPEGPLAASESPVAVPMSIWRRVRRDVAVLGAGNVGIVLAQLGFRTILLAALLPASYGRLSLILSLYNTIFIIGVGGLPNIVARQLAVSGPAHDATIVRSAARAAAWPTIVTATMMAVASGIVLGSPLASVFAVVGLSSLVYSLLAMGILRGRARIGPSAAILPIAAVGELAPLALLWFGGFGLTLISAFGVFCLGNFIGLGAGVCWTIRTAPRRATEAAASVSVDSAASSDAVAVAAVPADGPASEHVPGALQLLRGSMWLTVATACLAIMPLVMRFAAAFDSYTVVAVVDVALVLLSVPQRIGTVIVQAVIPHATRALRKGDVDLTISRREHFALIGTFALAAAVVAFTPLLHDLFSLLGRSSYGKSAVYLALALLAGPARILYGVVQGILVAHGESRFLARNALMITVGASGVIFAATALGHTVIAFAVFVVAWWLVYLFGLARTLHLRGAGAQAIAQAG
jgi:O-antigen/teichoic acid export membrane protein